MWEAAVEHDIAIRTCVPAHEPATARSASALLAAHGLTLDPGLDVLATAWDAQGLAACLGLDGDVVKCSAAHDRVRGTGVATLLMERITDEAAQRGHTLLFAYTKPANRAIFEGLGFHTLVSGEHAMLLENSPFALDAHLADLRRTALPGERIGAVVLNANPFTLGHRYLVEQAAARCDALHVFVVGEDASFFAADVRLRLVREGIATLDTSTPIVVHPGSRYIVSRATFPHYFIRGDEAHAVAAAELDLLLFRERLAPALGITDRFVGTEPLSGVTASYNREMRRWLEREPRDAPRIRIHELPRRELDGAPISASRVRALLAAGDLDALAPLVPPPTLRFIRATYFEKE